MKDRQIKFRIPAGLEPDVRWVAYCEGGITTQELIERALTDWLARQEEQKWGPPQVPKEKTLTPPAAVAPTPVKAAKKPKVDEDELLEETDAKSDVDLRRKGGRR